MINPYQSTVKKMVHKIESIETLADLRSETLLLFDNYFGLDQSIFWLCDRNGDIYSPLVRNINQNILHSYKDLFYAEDFLVPARVKSKLSMTRVLNIGDVISSSEYENSLFFNEFMKPNFIYHEMGVYLLSNNKLIGAISFTGGQSHPFVTETAIEKIELISYFISLKLHSILEKKEMTRQLGKLNVTPSEKSVCMLLQKGFTNQDIADSLFVSINTVKKHLQNIYQKNNITSRTDLIARLFSQSQSTPESNVIKKDPLIS